MKIVYSDPKTGKSNQTALDADKIAAFLNNKIGDTIDGTILGLQGYKLKITGGTDKSGFPLNRSIKSAVKTKIFKKISVSGKRKGEYKRMTTRGSTITLDVEQLNTVIIEYGDKPASELFPAKEKPKAEGKESK